jgi:hypothetical protein
VPHRPESINVGQPAGVCRYSGHDPIIVGIAVTLNFPAAAPAQHTAGVAKLIKVYRSFARRAFKSNANPAPHLS